MYENGLGGEKYYLNYIVYIVEKVHCKIINLRPYPTVIGTSMLYRDVLRIRQASTSLWLATSNVEFLNVKSTSNLKTSNMTFHVTVTSNNYFFLIFFEQITCYFIHLIIIKMNF